MNNFVFNENRMENVTLKKDEMAEIVAYLRFQGSDRNTVGQSMTISFYFNFHHQSVKITDICLILQHSVLFKFTFSEGFCYSR